MLYGFLLTEKLPTIFPEVVNPVTVLLLRFAAQTDAVGACMLVVAVVVGVVEVVIAEVVVEAVVVDVVMLVVVVIEVDALVETVVLGVGSVDGIVDMADVVDTAIESVNMHVTV